MRSGVAGMIVGAGTVMRAWRWCAGVMRIVVVARVEIGVRTDEGPRRRTATVTSVVTTGIDAMTGVAATTGIDVMTTGSVGETRFAKSGARSVSASAGSRPGTRMATSVPS